MYPRFKVWIGVALAINSMMAAAAQLGPMDIRSAVCQPLLLDIPVTQADPAELQNMTVQLVSQTGGVDRSRVVPTLHVALTPAVASTKQPILKVTSSVPITQPLLGVRLTFPGRKGSDVHDFHIALPVLTWGVPTSCLTQAATSTVALVQSSSQAAQNPVISSEVPALGRRGASNGHLTVTTYGTGPIWQVYDLTVY